MLNKYMQSGENKCVSLLLSRALSVSLSLSLSPPPLSLSMNLVANMVLGAITLNHELCHPSDDVTNLRGLLLHMVL
jgi:hypothetical protein